MKAVSYSPSRVLSDAVVELVHEYLPTALLFLRWRTNGSAIYVEASSGSTLVVVDFVKSEIRFSERLTYRGQPCEHGPLVLPIPEGWAQEFIGFDAAGNYADDATRDRMRARYAAEDAARRERLEAERVERELRQADNRRGAVAAYAPDSPTLPALEADVEQLEREVYPESWSADEIRKAERDDSLAGCGACQGHPDGPEMGVTFYCDGSCAR